ncbi:MAG TPA: long-chain fatty acid--CoA ligase [Solirubrobacteraceae bacterium]
MPASTTTPTPPRTAAPPRTIAALVLDAARRHPGTALRYPESDAWRQMSYADLGQAVREVTRGLIGLGVQPGDRVAILSNTRAEWTLADFGAMCAGAVVVPVYQTNSAEECQYVLAHSGATAIFCEDEQQIAKLTEIRETLPGLRHVIRFVGESQGALTLQRLRELGDSVPTDAVEQRVQAIAENDVASIVYTSGTTGPPKGCMLTHGNLCHTIDKVCQRMSMQPGEEVCYLFLPLAHVLARIVALFAIDAGGELAYWRRDPRKIIEDVALIKPTHLPSVPRVFEKIYTAANAKAKEAGGAKAKLFGWAVGVGGQVRERERRGGRPGLILKAQHTLADKLVLSKVRALFGGRIKVAITGAAPIDKEILSFFQAAGVFVMEGYGMTETSAVHTLNTVAEHHLGTVGRPLPGFDVRIAQDGEVLMRGANIFSGYFNDEEATSEALVDGWLHSGDLGELDGDGYLRITGRKKDLIITSSGKNISPSNIESTIAQSRWISQAVVYGDRRPYLTALLTLDPDQAEALAAKVGASDPDPAALAKHEGVRAELQSTVDEANRRFARIAQVKRFTILERDLSQEHEELTPTLKVKRNVVYERYGDRFAALYDGG